mmetsp:Transcript_20560/g.44937  ORF Transcript_20560/g.44937 Transcript_20560/m.44937 type:complete len:235 (-) Transcript_20560:752-1456(-)
MPGARAATAPSWRARYANKRRCARTSRIARGPSGHRGATAPAAAQAARRPGVAALPRLLAAEARPARPRTRRRSCPATRRPAKNRGPRTESGASGLHGRPVRHPAGVASHTASGRLPRWPLGRASQFKAMITRQSPATSWWSARNRSTASSRPGMSGRVAVRPATASRGAPEISPRRAEARASSAREPWRKPSPATSPKASLRARHARRPRRSSIAGCPIGALGRSAQSPAAEA